jgi:hypothetical protein
MVEPWSDISQFKIFLCLMLNSTDGKSVICVKLNPTKTPQFYVQIHLFLNLKFSSI